MNYLTNLMNHLSIWHGIIAAFLGGLLLSLFEKYNILPLNIVIYLLGLVGVLICGYNIGKTVGESTKKKTNQ